MSKMLTQLAARYGKHPRSIKRCCENGLVPRARREGKHWRIPNLTAEELRTLDARMKSHSRQSARRWRRNRSTLSPEKPVHFFDTVTRALAALTAANQSVHRLAPTLAKCAAVSTTCRANLPSVSIDFAAMKRTKLAVEYTLAAYGLVRADVADERLLSRDTELSRLIARTRVQDFVLPEAWRAARERPDETRILVAAKHLQLNEEALTAENLALSLGLLSRKAPSGKPRGCRRKLYRAPGFPGMERLAQMLPAVVVRRTDSEAELRRELSAIRGVSDDTFFADFGEMMADYEASRLFDDIGAMAAR